MRRRVLELVSAIALSGPFALASLGASTASEDPLDDPNYWSVSGSGTRITIGIGGGSSGGIPGYGDPTELTDGVAWTPGGAAAAPPSIPSGCLGQVAAGQWVADACPLTGTVDTEDPDPEDEAFVPPSTLEILYQALASVRIGTAGLVVQPVSSSYVGVPTLAHATTTSQTHTATILGYTIPLEVRATDFAFDFHDGTPPVYSTEPGAPWPDTTNQHTYTEPTDSTAITLTTWWSATVTNPFTGETLTVPGVLSTTETSQPFEVRTARTILTDTAEEYAGH